MWMAAGFAMLEAGLVRAKNTTEILTKNAALFAIACIMYFVCGYAIMYGGDFFLSTITADGVTGAEEPATYAPSADFFFQVVFLARTKPASNMAKPAAIHITSAPHTRK
jgi:Amt family ammonium transporter